MQQQVLKLEHISLTKLYASVAREKLTFDTYTLLIIIHGAGELWIDNKSYHLDKSGMVVYCKPGTAMHYTEESGHEQGLLFYQLTIGVYSKGARVPEGGLFNNGEVARRCYHQLRDLAESIELMNGVHSAAQDFKRQMLFNEMMFLISHEHEESKEKPDTTAIDSIIAYTESHYHEDIHRDQLARMVDLNPEYFSRLFKKVTGSTFSSYLTELRIRNAQQYLLTSRGSLREIAHRVGYSNEFYLSRKFKEVTGVSPTFYLQMPKRIASVSSHFTACLLALGVIPSVAKINPYIQELYKDSLCDGSTQLMDLHTFHYNQIVADASPDLIFCYDTYPELGDLKRTAPTISLSLNKLGWREQFMFIAEIVNANEKANELLGSLDEQVVQARRQLADKIGDHETVLILEIWNDKIMVIGDSGGRGGQLIYHMLKLNPPARVRSELFARQWYKLITPEELPLYSADYIFVTIYEEKGGSPYAAKIMNGNFWNSLPAIYKNRVFINDHSIFYNWDPVSLHVQLELLMRHFMS